MTLDASALQSAIRSILDSAQPSAAASADAFAGAYDDYCQGATFGASTPTLTGKRAVFASALAGAIASLTVPAGFAAAVAAYWTAVPVVGPQTGVCATCPGAGAVSGTIAALLPGPNSRDVFAAALAGALDTATRTCTATVSPPPGTILPIA